MDLKNEAEENGVKLVKLVNYKSLFEKRINSHHNSKRVQKKNDRFFLVILLIIV